MKKTLLIIAAIIVLLLVLLVIFISPITKYVVEKYDVKWTGREITMDWAYVNPFSGQIHLNDFKLYEKESDTLFISAEDLSFSLNIKKLISGNVELTSLVLEKPWARIVQLDKEHVNYGSLIEHFTSKDTLDTDTSKAEFNLTDIEINDGVIYYIDPAVPVHYFIKKFNFDSDGYRWDVDSINAKFSFESGPGEGDVEGTFMLKPSSLEYDFAVRIHKFDLKIFEQYLKDITNYGSLSANMDADFEARGNFHDVEDLTALGFMAINDFHFGKTPKDDYAAFEKLYFRASEMSPKGKKYLFDSVVLTKPYFVYEQYDQLNNIETMFGDNGSKVATGPGQKFNLIMEIATYVRELAKNFMKSYYKIDRVAVYRGEIEYNDYSLNERFSIGLNPLNISAVSIDKNDQRMKFVATSGLKPFGEMRINTSINPKNAEDFEMDYHIDKVAATMLNPYIVSYTSYPLDRGSIEVKGNWVVKDKRINSRNNIIVIDPRVGKKDHSKGTSWIPLKLIMAFVRERGNVIDYEVPITGTLTNPNFHIKDVILDLIRNIFVKPPTIPYRIQVTSLENEIEKSHAAKWEMRKPILRAKEEKFVEKMVEFLEKHPEASITVRPMKYELKEKEHITLFEARKRYYMSSRGIKGDQLSNEDVEKIEKMSNRDSGFVKFLNKFNDPRELRFTLQDKATHILGATLINKRYAELNKAREEKFRAFFKAKGVDGRIKMDKGENTIPYNGFSFYRIQYKGVRPEELTLAYKELRDLDNEPPREQYKDDRAKNKWWQFRRGKKQRD